MKKILSALLVLSILVSVSIAGWQRVQGKTKWISKPTAAPCFIRDRVNDVYPKRKVLVYYDTIKMLTPSAPQATGTGVVYNTGFCTIDASGDIAPINGLSNLYSQVGDLGALLDVELELDSKGDVYPKD